MSEDSPQHASNELIHWLKMLSLPLWARVGLALAMILALGGALSLLVVGIIQKDSDTISSGVTMLTIGMPVSLIVTAMVFGQGGAHKLRELTLTVLDKEIPEAILANIDGKIPNETRQFTELQRTCHGCVCEYRLIMRHENQPKQGLDFKIELNVRKVNVVIWLPDELTQNSNWRSNWFLPYMSSLNGAEREGYMRNEHPAQQMLDGKMQYGIVFIKMLDADFLLNPAERLYFSQDFAFFIRSLLEIRVSDA
jgi:hypothetical protein